jgi:hypothetical protein
VPYDERLSLCFEALCKAVLTHDPRRALLSTWFYHCSHQAVLHHLRRLRAERRHRQRLQRRRPPVRRRSETDPLEAAAQRDENCFVLRLVHRVATPAQRRILAELAGGDRLVDVAARLGCQPQTVSHHLADLRRRTRRALRALRRHRPSRFKAFLTEHP